MRRGLVTLSREGCRFHRAVAGLWTVRPPAGYQPAQGRAVLGGTVRVAMSSETGKPSFAAYVARVAALAAAYVVTAQAGLSLGALAGVATPVWPPAGIALGALLLGGYRLWPGIIVGAVLADLVGGSPFASALPIGIGSTLEAILGAYLLQQVAGIHNELARVRDVLALVILAALLSTLVGATIGTTSAWLGGLIPSASYLDAWFTWWVGDAMGDLIVAPLMLTWGTPARARERQGTYAELVVLLLLLAMSCVVVFGWLRRPAAWAVFPFTIWAALRFGQRGATSTVFLAAAIAIWTTAQGLGPFAGGGVRQDLLLVQLLLAVLSITGLTFAAVLTARQQAEETLRDTREQLRIVTDAMSAAVTRCSADLRYVWVSKAYAEWLGRAPEEMAGRPIVDIVGEEAVATLRPSFERVLSGERTEFERAVRFPRLGQRWVHAVFTPTHDPNGRVDGWVTAITDLTAHKEIEQSLATALDQRTRAEALLREAQTDLERRVRERTAQLQASNERLGELSRRLLTLRDEERRRIGQELHEGTAQTLAGAAMQLALVRQVSPSLGAPAQAAIAECLALIDQCARELRTASYVLHPPLLDEIGLESACRWYADGFTRRSGITVDLHVAPDVKRLPPVVERTLFRLLEESLDNVQRHAGSATVRVEVARTPGAVTLTVADTGCGMPPEILDALTAGDPRVGTGVLLMHERVRQVGGHLRFVSGPDGTVVEATLPVTESPSAPMGS